MSAVARFSRPALLLFSLVAALCFAASAPAQTFSPYSDFQAMTLSDLATLQVKLTYMGNQTTAVGTLLFGAAGNTLNAGLFVPFHRSGQPYFNDDVGQYKFTASVTELKAMIDSVATLADVTDGDADPNGTVSFSLLNTVGGTTKVFEAIVNKTTGRPLFGEMLTVFRNNSAVVGFLRAFGCAAEMLPATPPADIEGQVQVKAGGLRADRRSPGQFVGRVRVTNTSGTAMQAPVTLVAVVDGDAELIGADGKTCNIAPPGNPFVNLITAGSLAPGATVERTLKFANPSGNKLNVSYRVFAGAGTL